MKKHFISPRTSMRDGFTLIELLLVLGIISILIGLLLPALSGVRASANQTACSVEMRQLATQISMYTNNSKGYVPFVYLRDQQTNGWITPSGTTVPDGYLETAGDFWHLTMPDQFQAYPIDSSLLCPNDWVTMEATERIANDAGIPVERLRLPLNRALSRAFYRSAQSLHKDNLNDTAVLTDRVNKLTNVRFPSAKALLIEDPPFHDDFLVGEEWNIYADLPYRKMVVAADLSVQLRSIKDATPAILTEVSIPSNYPGDPDQYLATQRLLAAFHYTRDGIQGRDW